MQETEQADGDTVDRDEEMDSVHEADVTMEQDSAALQPTLDATSSTFDSATTEATTAMNASPHSKRTRQPSEEQELGSLSGSTNLPSLTSAAIAPPSAPTSVADIILEDVDEEDSLDSEWDVVGKTEPEGPIRPIPSSRNGERGATLWARGFKDKYKMAVALPRGPASPLRAPISRNGSRRGSSHGGSVRSSNSQQPSPPPTPEPRQSPIRRLASMRSSSSNNVRSRPADDENADTSALETPKRAGSTIKRITLSAFRPSRTPSQSS